MTEPSAEGQEPTYGVMRGVGGDLEGLWYRTDNMPVGSDSTDYIETSRITVHSTGEYETREDGVMAEVYRPEPLMEGPHDYVEPTHDLEPCKVCGKPTKGEFLCAKCKK